MAAPRTLQQLEAEVYYITRVHFTDLNQEDKNIDTLFDMLDTGGNLMYNQRYRENDIDISSFTVFRTGLGPGNMEPIVRARWTGEQPQPWRVGNQAYSGSELKQFIESQIHPELAPIRQRGRNLAALRQTIAAKEVPTTGANWYYGPKTAVPNTVKGRNIRGLLGSFLTGIPGTTNQQENRLANQAFIQSLNEMRQNEEEYRMHPNQPNRGGRRTRRRKTRRRRSSHRT